MTEGRGRGGVFNFFKKIRGEGEQTADHHDPRLSHEKPLALSHKQENSKEYYSVLNETADKLGFWPSPQMPIPTVTRLESLVREHNVHLTVILRLMEEAESGNIRSFKDSQACKRVLIELYNKINPE